MKKWCTLSVIWLAFQSCLASDSDKSEYVYHKGGKTYRYFVIQSGENYNFEFETNPGNRTDRFQAGLHVLYSLYHDSSIHANSKRYYIKERAHCYALESSFKTYSLCMLPNDFTTDDKKDRFWGFVTQMPNWKWLVTFNLLPVLLGFGVIFFFTRKKHS
ncbi:MAG: hypothetical protein ACU85E_05885 [Gammaproteobacteria bacterium]